jgi:hypothetical protein
LRRLSDKLVPRARKVRSELPDQPGRLGQWGFQDCRVLWVPRVRPALLALPELLDLQELPELLARLDLLVHEAQPVVSVHRDLRVTQVL